MATIRLDLVIDCDPSTKWWRVFAVDVESGHKYFSGDPNHLSPVIIKIHELVATHHIEDPYLQIVINSAIRL